mgnify:CR=1 FL=1
MKLIQDIALTTFSILILIIAIIVSIVMLGWMDLGFINSIIEGIIANETSKIIILSVNVILILLSLASLFYDTNKKTVRDGILMENEKGNLLISRSALTKIINGVIAEFDSVKPNNTSISLDKDGLLNIDVQISVTKDVIIKDLTNNLQIKIKDAIKKSSDLEVKTVNIGIQNVIENENTTAQA